MLTAMRKLPIALLCLALGGLALPACKPAVGSGLNEPGSAIVVNDLDDFERGLNRFALASPKTKVRAQQRAQLLHFLVGYLDARRRGGDQDEAVQALRYGIALFTPVELRDRELGAPELASAAHEVYRMAARRGAEKPSLLALAVAQRFGDDAARARAVEQWDVLEQWVVRNGPFAAEPLLRHDELERALEDVAAVFPSPFVVERLADLYVARYQAALKIRDGDAGSAARKRVEFTGYLLMRLYLRADDVEGARTAMKRVELDLQVAKLAAMMDEAFRPRRSATALLAFAEQFAPDPGTEPDEPYAVQGWAIVDNISRRAVASHPKDAYAHLLRARTLRQAGLGAAAMEHLRQCIALKEDVFAAWQELAQLEQRELERSAASNPKGAADRLPQIERLHARAAQLWADRPIRPGLPEAFYTVAEGLYEVGEGKRAEQLLQRSVGIEPVPSSLDLLGTIALKRSKLAEAQARYEDLANLAFDNEVSQLQWEARARQQLGAIALLRGDTAGSMRHIRMALRHTNELLARPSDDVQDRASRLVERGKLLFFLGDTELAMTDFARASELAPNDPKVYTEPLITVVSYGYLGEARTIYRRAMGRPGLSDTLKLYFSLWIVELAKRQGGGGDPEAEAHVKAYRADKWGRMLARHARGEVDFEALTGAARDRGQKAEAYFYEALRRWDAGDTGAAKTLLNKVIATGMMGFFEYEMAQHYLDWDELPRVARAPLGGGVGASAR
jgi:tetratricopeptide (TPR) repeat protein